MIQAILTKSDSAQTLVWCHFADLKKGIVNFKKYLQRHNPEVSFSNEMVEAWTKFCAIPPESEPPPDLCTRAVQQRARGTLPEQIYDFAFRVDSQAMHSNTRVLVERA